MMAKVNVMVRERNMPGTIMPMDEIPKVGDRIKTVLMRELEVIRVTHTPRGQYDAEVDVK